MLHRGHQPARAETFGAPRRRSVDVEPRNYREFKRAAADGCGEALLASDLLETIARDSLYDAVLDSAPLLAPDTEIFRRGMKIAVTDSP